MSRTLLLASIALTAACGLLPDTTPSSGRIHGRVGGRDLDCALDADASEFHRTASGYDVHLTGCDGEFEARGHLAVVGVLGPESVGTHPVPDCVFVAGAASAEIVDVAPSDTDAGTPPEQEPAAADAQAGDPSTQQTDGGTPVVIAAASSVEGTWICAPRVDADPFVDGWDVVEADAAVSVESGELTLESTAAYRLAGKVVLHLVGGAVVEITHDLREALELEGAATGTGSTSSHHHFHHFHHHF